MVILCGWGGRVAGVPNARLDIAENYLDGSSTLKGNILIVDDLIENLHFLTEMLGKRGYKVRSVTNGKMALYHSKSWKLRRNL
ncbi:hypothetical protein ACL6C3_17720 [Capilliphycus salinus ALCB114379]|uniref:hypothetical protein n=1 Tax=Capilliphycus salinus TaxID=2768948 RepID=UPI0039A64692